jgi:ribosomal 50S subunit-recycling heat shock protein
MPSRPCSPEVSSDGEPAVSDVGPVEPVFASAFASLFASSGGFEFEATWITGGIAVLLAEAGVFASRGEARRMIAAGGVTVNGERVTDPEARPEPIAGAWLDVRIGKRRREIGRANQPLRRIAARVEGGRGRGRESRPARGDDGRVAPQRLTATRAVLV